MAINNNPHKARSKAPRRNAMNIEEARAKIQTTQIVKRLTDHAVGKIDMSASQVQAALGLLRKSLPDLSAVEHTGTVTVESQIIGFIQALDGPRDITPRQPRLEHDSGTDIEGHSTNGKH